MITNTSFFCSEHREHFVTNIRHLLLRTSAVFTPNIRLSSFRTSELFCYEHPYILNTKSLKNIVSCGSEHPDDFRSEHPVFFIPIFRTFHSEHPHFSKETDVRYGLQLPMSVKKKQDEKGLPP